MTMKPGEQYHVETAALMADLSALVYPAPGEYEGDWEERCRETLKDRYDVSLRVVADDVNLAIVVEFPDWRAIVIRGTDQQEDWGETNLKYRWKLKTPFGNIHRGFWASTQALNEGLFRSATGKWASYRPTWITGHSMGGAVATLLPHILDKSKCGVKGVYTFGQPRVGGWRFREKHNKKFGEITYRHYSYGDPIPHTPPLWRGYCHTETGYYLDREGRIHTQPAWWQRVKNTVSALLADKDGWRVSQHHQMAAYRSLLDLNLLRLKGAAWDESSACWPWPA